MKKIICLLVFIGALADCSAQAVTNTVRDSLRKKFYGNYTYTLQYGWENIDLGNGQSMEVVPLSMDVTVTQLELYRYGEYARETFSSNEDSYAMMFHHVEYGKWRMQGDTLFLKATHRAYDFPFYFSYSNSFPLTATEIENPIEENLFLAGDNCFCNQKDWSANPKYAVCYCRNYE